MSKYEICERCPDEHTRKCDNCNPSRQQDQITYADAIKYFKEENVRYENLLGEKAKILPEYRTNLLAIEALKKIEIT